MTTVGVDPDRRPIFLVTGATGYVGGRLVRELVERGVRVLHSPDTPSGSAISRGRIRSKLQLGMPVILNL